MTLMNLRHAIWFSLMLGLLGAMDTLPVHGQKVGEKVCVMVPSDAKIRDKVVDQVYAGEVHRLLAIEGNWCALKDVDGWVPLKTVMTLDAAMKQYDARVAKNPRDWDALANRGLLHYEIGEYTRAFTDLNKALELVPNNSVLWNNRGRVLKAQGKLSLAAGDFKRASELNPKYAYPHFNLGLVYYAANNFAESIKSYDEAIRLEGKEAWFYINRGNAKHASNDASAAMADYDAAEKLDPKIAEIFVGRSNVFLSEGKFDDALAAAEKAVQLDERDPSALNTRGWVKYKMKDREGALKDLTSAIQIAPRLPLPYTNRGIVYGELKQYDNAIRDLSRSIALQPDVAIAYVNRANVYLAQGDWKKAKSDYEDGLKRAEEIPETNGGLAWLLATADDEGIRDPGRALELAKRACELSNWEDTTYLDTYAASLAVNGDFDEAIKFSRQAVEKSKESERAKYEEHLAVFEQKKPYVSRAQ